MDKSLHDVKKEDLMKIQRLDKKKVEEQPLPQMIREYILHDRGNSIFLGDSFANLPSPVGEGQTIKNLFKFNEDDDEDKRKLDKGKEKEKNEIKIEGKKEQKTSPKKEQANFKMDTKRLMKLTKLCLQVIRQRKIVKEMKSQQIMIHTLTCSKPN